MLYVEKIGKVIDYEISQNYSSKLFHWEMIKMGVPGATVRYAARKKRSNENKIQALERKLAEVEARAQEDNNPSSNDTPLPYGLNNNVEQQLFELRKEIDELLEIKAKGVMIRSKANWVELGEKPTSYYLSLEAHRANKRN